QVGDSAVTGDISGDEAAVMASTPANTEASGELTEGVDNTTPGSTVEADQLPGDEPELKAMRTQDNGKLPEDIPSADNDSALEMQIRKAAMEETDLELKKRLWDEYRRYKGLPISN
ncbi:MAG TPA: hypothetical protein DIT35_02520, partial [Rhodospirillaceae bacterium]|nr:hypothetical protein [Rhodospirillaceae bacterium]